MRYEIGQNAYIKLVLQALNHNTSAVNGLLLGRLSAYNNDVVEITESVPLFHSQIDLLPPLEIALIQIYVVDSLDRERIGKAKQEFQAIIRDSFMLNSIILMFANKQDMVCYLSNL
ncbi:hypothetical protein RHGRI_003153 [Rhododendron griersonianum]|uniref:Uncharacterized protein n=1 Tax=Rhododendron griersonianum TaxID=479676 RepID=A0AAV6L3U7_9ERIC|nr:hypothetical protein RHGRI_003153 [Rhododendron griersonianum]